MQVQQMLLVTCVWGDTGADASLLLLLDFL
jgi:hypothetical protein